MQAAASKTFRDLCAEHGIAVTHQRQVLYEVMQGMSGHPSPEEVYARVKKKIPAISLATVYKKHSFICGERRLSQDEPASWLGAGRDE